MATPPTEQALCQQPTKAFCRARPPNLRVCPSLLFQWPHCIAVRSPATLTRCISRSQCRQAIWLLLANTHTQPHTYLHASEATHPSRSASAQNQSLFGLATCVNEATSWRRGHSLTPRQRTLAPTSPKTPVTSDVIGGGGHLFQHSGGLKIAH